ncbi:Aspergillopepsin-F [Arthrobotrys entomopaga]|nr:Aspergillopepsin-F [Arthrobotrys entomopaga]
MDFDTGSADLWVFSNLLPASIQKTHTQNKGKIYIPGKTSSSTTPMTWAITYADGGSASGTVVNDTVKIGGITVTKQAVEMAKTVSSSFEGFSGDGLLGLSFGTINQISPKPQATWFENAMSQLKQKIFTANLNFNAVGAYTWGYINSTYARSVKWAPLRSGTGWWQVNASPSIKVNGVQYRDSTSNSLGAVIDTGSTLLILSEAMVKNYYAKVPGATFQSSMGAWVYPCKSTSDSSMPSISVPVGNNWITVPGKYMTYAFANSAGTVCFGGLQSMGAMSGLPWIYGDVFFRGAYTVFDYGNRRLGVAQKS